MVYSLHKQIFCILFLMTMNNYVVMTERKSAKVSAKRYKRYNYGGFGDDDTPYSPTNYYYPKWKPDTYNSHNFYGPSHWEHKNFGYGEQDYYDGFQYPQPHFRQNDYDSYESEEDYGDKSNETPLKNADKKYDYPEQSIPDNEIPEPSNENKEATTKRVSIIGKPVVVPPDDDIGDQIIFQDTSTETPEQRRCVQDCPTTSEYSPVCGTNNVTYFNTGKFKCARDCGIDVFIKFNGRCPGATSEARPS